MGKIVCLISLPGGGKSYVAKNEYEPLGYKVIDDPKRGLFDPAKLDNTKNYVICDPHLCNPKNRLEAQLRLELLGFKISFIYFENNPSKCRNNIKHRNDGRIIGDLKWFCYQIPKGVKARKIWQSI